MPQAPVADNPLRLAMAAAFRSYREASGLSLRQVARATGYAHTTLYDIEARGRWPAPELIFAFCAAVGVDMCDLLEALSRRCRETKDSV